MTSATTNITIHCPVHGDIEIITIPQGYIESEFKGEVRCNPRTKVYTSGTLWIELGIGKIVCRRAQES